MAKKGIHVNVYKLPDGTWRCDLKLNTSEAGEGVTVRGTSEGDDSPAMGAWWDKLSGAGKALAKTRLIARAILNNPAVAAAFPQYVAPALLTLKAIEKAEKRGLLGKVKKQFTDPTLKKLATEMDEMSKGTRSAMSGGGCCIAAEPRGSKRHGYNVGAMMGDSFPSSKFKVSPFGNDINQTGPFGLPQGNPHPFAEWVRRDIAKGAKDPLEMQKLAAMHAMQRRLARNSR